MSIRVKGNRNVEAAPGVHVRPTLVMRTTTRRFLPPWSVEEWDACYVVPITTDRRSRMFISRMNRG
jgi:hypothetical protein